jgi:hypothetical protein
MVLLQPLQDRNITVPDASLQLGTHCDRAPWWLSQYTRYTLS